MTTTEEPLDTYPHEYAGDDAPAPVQPTPAEIAEGRELRAAQRLEAGELLELPPWRLAVSVGTLRTEANLANPRRDRASDGTIADSAHATTSDHYPWLKVAGLGVVRAGDLDADGLDLPAAFERGRRAALEGRLPQVVGGGYFILNRRITSPTFDRWRVYTGPNPHTGHGHVSTSREVARFDSRVGWGIFGAGVMPAPTPIGWTGPDLTGSGTGLRGRKGCNGKRVHELQRQLVGRFPLYAKHLRVDGWWGDQTTGVVREFARRSGIAADGLNIGPRIAAALGRAGVQP